MKTFFVLAVVLLMSSLAQAQVLVAPTLLFVSDQSRFGTFFVMNRSNVPQEISISFRFGYPVSDSTGNVWMQYDDSLMAQNHSCRSWVRGFPEKFVINPGQRQVVRLLISPPPMIPDGEYWTRLITDFHATIEGDGYDHDRDYGKHKFRSPAGHYHRLPQGRRKHCRGFAGGEDSARFNVDEFVGDRISKWKLSLLR